MAKPEALARWMRAQLSSSGAKGFVVGLSGGLDSAVVARLAQLAAPGNVLGALLPCQSDPRDERDALEVANQFYLPTIRIDLGPAYDRLTVDAHTAFDDLLRGRSDLTPQAEDDRVAAANVKPRLRMTTLYYLANALNYLVAGTGNRSELAVGYFTKYGDGGVDLLPLGALLKRDVVALAHELNLPAAVIERSPSAGLWDGQTDEEELGFTYDQLERYLGEGPQGVPPAVAMKIERLMRGSEHKRAMPPVPDER